VRLHLFEARTAGDTLGNWGKFAVGVPGEDEWLWRSAIPDEPDGLPPSDTALLRRLGWAPRHVWVWDLQTGEGAMFLHGGMARADLAKHQIWVCPLFEGFLAWLYRQDLAALADLPRVVEIEREFRFYGYRRAGVWFERATGVVTVLPGGRGMCLGLCGKGMPDRK
jgi:hypothetical protein